MAFKRFSIYALKDVLLNLRLTAASNLSLDFWYIGYPFVYIWITDYTFKFGSDPPAHKPTTIWYVKRQTVPVAAKPFPSEWLLGVW